MSKKSLKHSFWLHLLAWIVFFLYELIIKGQLFEHPENLQAELILVSIRVACIMILVYFVLYFLFEKVYQSDYKKNFFLLLPLSILACSYCMRSLNYFLYFKPKKIAYDSIFEVLIQHSKTFIYFGNISFVLGMAALFYFLNKWNQQEKRSKELEASQKAAELQQLKSQIQPHFLFNTLNNIQALVKQNSPHSSEAIVRLSNLLEHSLYQNKKIWIPLENELAYLKDYIELEKLRYGPRLHVAINVFCNLHDWQVPSFILLPLVENAFKHGLSQQTSEGFLLIELNEQNMNKQDNWLIIKIENSLEESLNKIQSKKNENETPGIGINNVKRRLNLLYPQQHQIHISKNRETHQVLLKLHKNEHGKPSTK